MNCAFLFLKIPRVQLITRIERPRNSSLPFILIEVDTAALTRMYSTNPETAIYNEAILILHEAIYALASSGGDWNSKGLEKLTSLILSQELSAQVSSQKLMLNFRRLVDEKLLVSTSRCTN